jgi:tetratricopeptide (TPR) repeat protein
MTATYDVFLSHNSADKPAVELVALRLRDEAGLRPFLDKWHLVPGESWIPGLEQAIEGSGAVAVFFGPEGVGRWHDEEKQLALVCGKRVIPVLLPGARRNDVVGFLRLRTWVDVDQEDGFARLVAGIKGQAPELLLDLDVERLRDAVRQGLPPKVASTRLPHNATKLFGRETELERLDALWAANGAGKTNVVTLVAWGGVGKTSLVVEWMNRLAAEGWRGARAVFDWSFYSQGVREQGAPSADQFVSEALRFFGDEALAKTNASAWDKGSRLAELVAQQRTLLVLDGLEPLQQPPGRAAKQGKLTDPAIEALLRGLARTNAGLCVVTTREVVEDLVGRGAVESWPLERLSQEAADGLLRYLLEEEGQGVPPVTSTAIERAEVWEAVEGHALTLQLLGRYIRRALGDFRRWREIELHRADEDVQGGHAFHVMEAYERWLSGEGNVRGQRQLAVLRLLGFFDRAADPGCIGTLCEAPPITGLTEPLVELDAAGWRLVLADLAALGLVSTAEIGALRIEGFPKAQTDLDTGRTTGAPEVKVMPGWPRLTESLDAHPLVREHFGRRVRQTSEAAWKEGHRRVFEHLCESTPYWPEGLQGLQPLYQAVAHGCQAGKVEEARADVYRDRILRGTSYGGFYTWKKLGVFGADLGALAWFFERMWSQPLPSIAEDDQAWLATEAATRLRALGRLAEAVEPMRAGLERCIGQQDWRNAAVGAINLSELELTRGEATEAMSMAEQSVTFADRSKDIGWSMASRETHGDALHQAGHRDEARQQFEKAEAMQAEREPSYPQLYSLGGFRFGDLLLSDAEHTAWLVTLKRGNDSFLAVFGAASIGGARSSTSEDATAHVIALAACDSALGRGTYTLEVSTRNKWLLDIALDHLSLGRASLYRALLVGPASNLAFGPAPPDQRCPASPLNLAAAMQHLDAAVEGLRGAGQVQELPRGLLSRAWLHHLLGNPTAATADLDEAESLATRCGMPIFLADVHLTRARLFRDRTELTKARELLLDLRTRGYHRHDEMLADAEAAAESWPEKSTP